MFGKNKEFTTAGSIIEGLPIPAETMTTIMLNDDGFEIKALIGRRKEDWKTFELPLEKVHSVQMFDERQIKQIIEQSAPGMILGAATFGVLGALVGGRTKTKEKIMIKTLLVIEYVSNENKQIVLNVSNSIKDCSRLVNHFRELKPNQNQIIQL